MQWDLAEISNGSCNQLRQPAIAANEMPRDATPRQGRQHLAHLAARLKQMLRTLVTASPRRGTRSSHPPPWRASQGRYGVPAPTMACKPRSNSLSPNIVGQGRTTRCQPACFPGTPQGHRAAPPSCTGANIKSGKVHQNEERNRKMVLPRRVPANCDDLGSFQTSVFRCF